MADSVNGRRQAMAAGREDGLRTDPPTPDDLRLLAGRLRPGPAEPQEHVVLILSLGTVVADTQLASHWWQTGDDQVIRY